MLIDIGSDRSERVRYDHPDFPIYIRKDPLSIFPDFTADSHWHDDIEMILAVSGHMMYSVNGETIRLEEGEGIFINGRQLHFGFSDDKTECTYICILFHPLILCSSEMFEQQYVIPLLQADLPFVHLSPGVGWQNTILKSINAICERKDTDTGPLWATGMLCLIWSEIMLHALPDRQITKHNSKLITLKEMISYIREHYPEKLTLTEVAEAGHISRRSCGYLFLKYLNQTPMTFLMEHRLKKSIELMRQTDLTILEISLAVGFSGASYYAEVFRKRFGQSPAEYRKTLKAKDRAEQLLR